MLHWILSSLWDSAFAQFGIAGLVLIGCVCVFIWVPLAAVRHAAVLVAAVAVFFLIFAPRFYIMGVQYEKAKWDAAVVSDIKRGNDARNQAEAEVPPVPAVPATPGAVNAPSVPPAADAARAPSPKTAHGIRGVIRRVFHRRARRVRGHDPNNRDGG